jgi:hypothetical protein
LRDLGVGVRGGLEGFVDRRHWGRDFGAHCGVRGEQPPTRTIVVDVTKAIHTLTWQNTADTQLTNPTLSETLPAGTVVLDCNPIGYGAPPPARRARSPQPPP